MNFEKLQELAALGAVGALPSQKSEELQRLISEGDSSATSEIAKFNDVAVFFAIARANFQLPLADLKQRVLRQIDLREETSRSESLRQQSIPPGFALVRGDDERGWRKLATPGALVKLLSMDRDRGYAVVLGKLEPGARYPSHHHTGSEEVYVLEGDLHMGSHVLRAGDFHHSDAGTSHGENFSEQGCTILAVISSPDLLAQISQT